MNTKKTNRFSFSSLGNANVKTRTEKRQEKEKATKEKLSLVLTILNIISIVAKLVKTLID